MKMGAIIQARMSSTRFSGKVLHKVAGKPMLQYLLERIDHCSALDAIIVATSTDESDTPIAEFCRQYGVACHRGPLFDVAARIKDVLTVSKLDGFVRISGDSPLLDQSLIDLGFKLFLNGDYDMVTNLLPRTFPKGQSIEILRTDVFNATFGKMKHNDDLEHVTKFFYRNLGCYRIYNFESGKRLGDIQLSVDTNEDMMKFDQIVRSMDRDHWCYGYEDILEILSALNEDFRQGK